MWSLEPVFKQFDLPYKKPDIQSFERQKQVKSGLRRTAGYLFLTFTLGPIALLIIWFLVRFFTELSKMTFK